MTWDNQGRTKWVSQEVDIANYRIAFKCTMKPVKKNGKWGYIERRGP